MYTKKKYQLDEGLLQLHLNLASSGNNLWPYIQHTITATEMSQLKIKSLRGTAQKPVYIYIFYVLLTVHLSIFISVINQLNAQILFYKKFIIFLYMFRALLCSSSGGQIVLYSIWYRHTL